jgi:hypothetical protein
MFSRLNARAISTLKRSRLAVAALLCLLVAVVSILIIPITRGANPAVGTVSEANPQINWTGASSPSSSSPSISSATNLVYQLTYNPVLNSITVQLISPQ